MAFSWTELADFTQWASAPDKATLLIELRRRLNESSPAFWTDPELNDWLDYGAKDVSARLLCLETYAQGATTSGSGIYALPDNVIKVFRLLYCDGGNWTRLSYIEWRDYDTHYLWSSATDTSNPPDFFTLYQQQLLLVPAPAYTALGAGTAIITAGGLAEKFTYGTSLTASCTAFVTSWATAYTAVGIVLTSSGANLIFTAAVAGTGFTSPAMTNDTLGLIGTVVHTTANSVGIKQVDTMTVSATNLKLYYYKYQSPVSTTTDKYLIPPEYYELILDFAVYQAFRKGKNWTDANLVYMDYLKKIDRAVIELHQKQKDRYSIIKDVTDEGYMGRKLVL